jgi:hypothetical protein
VTKKTATFFALAKLNRSSVGLAADAYAEDIVPSESLLLSSSYDLAALVPEKVRDATLASEAYKLFFVFESYLREFMVEALTKEGDSKTWWDYVPPDVKDGVDRLEQTEEVKSWMALTKTSPRRVRGWPRLKN